MRSAGGARLVFLGRPRALLERCALSGLRAGVPLVRCSGKRERSPPMLRPRAARTAPPDGASCAPLRRERAHWPVEACAALRRHAPLDALAALGGRS